jgi:hypothetical protein
MAVAFTKVVTTEYMIKYRVTSAGAESGNLDAAGAATPDLITDSLPGSKLRQVLQSTVANQAAGRALLFDRNDIQIIFVPRDADAAWTIDGNTDGSSRLRLTMASAAADALGSYITIRYNHSTTR